jgi:hypothetical protein
VLVYHVRGPVFDAQYHKEINKKKKLSKYGIFETPQTAPIYFPVNPCPHNREATTTPFLHHSLILLVLEVHLKVKCTRFLFLSIVF